MQLQTSRAIFDYWNLIRDGKAAPSRSDLAPGPISALLPELFILDWDTDGDIRYRLAGTRVCTLLGKELRGRSFTGLWSSAQQAGVAKLVHAMAARSMPLLLDVTGSRRDYPPLKFEMLLLPLGDNDGTPTRMLGSLAPEQVASWQSPEPLVELKIDAIHPLSDPAAPAQDVEHHAGRVGLRGLWHRLLRRPQPHMHGPVFADLPASSAPSE